MNIFIRVPNSLSLSLSRRSQAFFYRRGYYASADSSPSFNFFYVLFCTHTSCLSLPFNVCKLIFVMYGKVTKKIITMATFAHSFSRTVDVTCVFFSLLSFYVLFYLPMPIEIVVSTVMFLFSPV